jgi:branched-chain amino acid transport system permease protein
VSRLLPTTGRRRLLTTALAVVVVLVASGFVNDFRAQQWTQWLAYCLLALSFSWVWGHGGIFSFGQAAFFGLGGYTYGIVAINVMPDTNETFTAVLGAIVVAAVAAGFIGYFMFYGKVTDVYIAIVTLAASLVLYTLMSSTADPKYHVGDAPLGGFNGMIGIPPLSYGLPGGTPTTLDAQSLLAVVAVISVLAGFGVHALRRRAFGRVVRALRENEDRTALLGFDVRRYKLVSFVLAGALAGLAGAIYAAWGNFIDPSVFGLQLATLIAIWVLLGGHTSVVGAFVGVFIVQQLSTTLAATGSTSTPLVLGAVLILVVLAMPRGIVPTAVSLWARLRGRGGHEGKADVVAEVVRAPRGPLPVPADAPSGLELKVSGIRKVFGGVAAVNGVDLAFPAKGVHCLLGPNGAGKSTLFHLLVGRHRPTEGDVALAGSTISRARPDQRARQGIGIKLQVASLFTELSVRENLWLAAYGGRRDPRVAAERADEMLAWLGLSDRADEPAGALAHGEQQWLDIGMVMATSPRVVLLDEPTAGMGRAESSRMAQLIRELGERVPVVVVEHDMEFVRELDAPVTVLHEGRILARGTMAEIRENEQVLDVYLGRGVRVTA